MRDDNSTKANQVKKVLDVLCIRLHHFDHCPFRKPASGAVHSLEGEASSGTFGLSRASRRLKRPLSAHVFVVLECIATQRLRKSEAPWNDGDIGGNPETLA